jgi:lipopolysaccharide export system permease protein
MNTIGLYVLRQALKPFLVIIGIALLLLLVERALRLLDQVLGFGGSPVLLLEMLAFLVPHYMALALPAGFYLGVLLTFSAMHERNELDALGSAGIGLFQMMRPLLLFGLALGIFAALNASFAQPYSRYVYRSLIHFVAESSISGYLRERTAVEVGRFTFLADRIRPTSRRYDKMFIFEETKEGGSVAITAERARLMQTDEDRRMVLALENGVRMAQSPEYAVPDEIDEEEILEDGVGGPDLMVFERIDVPITIDNPGDFRSRGRDERELTFIELWRLRDAPPSGATKGQMLAELNNHLVRAISIAFLPLMAVGLAIGPRRMHRAYTIAIGFVVIIVYNEILDIGKFATADGSLNPFVNQWMPFGLFLSGSFYLFLRATLRVPSGQALPAPVLWLEIGLRFAWRTVRQRIRRR